MPTEPINLQEWIIESNFEGRLFTCGRPGRAIHGTKKIKVEWPILNQWAKGLMRLGPLVHIVSLLGTKTTGLSEFWFYPFKSALEEGEKPSFGEWLRSHYGERFVVREFPTVDARPVSEHVLGDVVAHVRALLDNQIVVVVDSAGAVRAGKVAGHFGHRAS